MSCQRFVQNTWKKELCSNCFKSKDEHAAIPDPRAKYLTSLKNSSNKPPPQGILKGTKVKKSSARVKFPAEESHIIGYGGEEVSDDEDFIENSFDESNFVEDDIAECEEEKALQRLTKTNTDFNSNMANLCKNELVTEVKKTSFTPLQLGKVQKDADGRKQTLLVSVQPFGSENGSSPLAISRKTHLNNILMENKDSQKITLKQNVKQEKSHEINVVKCSVDKSTVFNKTVFNENVIQIDETQKVNVKSETKVLNAKVIEKVNSSIVPAKPVEKDECDKVNITDINDLNTLKESKKSQITRGSVLSKMHDQGKSNRYFNLNTVNKRDDKKKVDVLSTENKHNKTDNETNKTSVNVQQNNIKNISSGMFTSRLVYTDISTSSEESDSSGNDSSQSDNQTSDELKTDTNCVKILVKEEEDKKEVTLQVMKILDTDGMPAESREMAGEPDGRADPDEVDDIPPDLPRSPPPLLTEHIPRPSFLHNITKEKPKIPVKPKLLDSSPLREIPPVLDLNKKSQSLSSIDPQMSPTDNGKSTKRQAPKPPPSTTENVLLAYNTSSQMSIESPLVHHEKKELRERAVSCTPLTNEPSSTPEPAPRRSLSLSQDSLSSSNNQATSDKKRSNKVRSTLKKFWRLASRDEDKGEDCMTPPPPPLRTRLEIIHPLDLNKSAVQVLRGDGSLVVETKVENSTPSPTSPSPYAFPGRPNKPPPPPRSQSLDMSQDTKPARPPPPKTELLNIKRHSIPITTVDSVYANIGEARSGIAPNKPQRTASIRENQMKDVPDYEPVQVSDSQVFLDSENLYECLAPECDLNRERSSLPYCGSETESDIYYPYNFANIQDGMLKLEDAEQSKGAKSERLRGRKGRSIVHKSLEENYGAVVVANHEALSQLLKQISMNLVVPVPLRSLKTIPNLQWSDFNINDDSANVVVGGRVFLSAQWNQLPVTLCLTAGQSRLPNSLSPITQFFDLVASKYVNHEKTELVQVSVAVLVYQQVFTLESYGTTLKSLTDTSRETALLLLQLINGLKDLQARGIEDTNLLQFVLCRDEHECVPKVCLLPQNADVKSAERMSLCQCAIAGIDALPQVDHLSTLLRKVLVQERATSLSQAKAALEFWLWGPAQILISSDIQESLQRWLDLERATILHSLVINRPPRMNTADYCHVSFLVLTNAKIMADAMALIDKPDASSC